MKILWLTNVALPEASDLMGEKSNTFGGWLINASKILSKEEQINLTVIFPKENISNIKSFKGEKIQYFAFPTTENKDLENERNEYFDEILRVVKPDLIHIYGTEFAHTQSMIQTAKRDKIKTVTSIQGLVSIYAEHMYANLPFHVIYGFTLKDLIRKDNIMSQKKKFQARGVNEIKALEMSSHVIGRTSWDYATTKQFNQEVNYHFCNETLREEFYNHKWDYNKSIKHSIFLSQGQYPIKGAHIAIKALPLILKEFPDSKIFIGGTDITKVKTFKDKLTISYYGKYLNFLINKLNLTDKVIFTGPLTEKLMCERFLKSNVFVSPSSIENSPNSLGEAMILGMPTVSSYVGGVADMIEHKKEGYLFQADAPYMLAHYVCEVFSNPAESQQMGEKARVRAKLTHNREANNLRLIEIYENILESE